MYVDETLSFSSSSMSNFKHSDQELIGCSLSNSSFVTFASTSKDCCFVIIFLWLQIPWWTAAEACGGLQKWLPYIIGYRISAFCSSVEGFIEANSRKPRREREKSVWSWYVYKTTSIKLALTLVTDLCSARCVHAISCHQKEHHAVLT